MPAIYSATSLLIPHRLSINLTRTRIFLDSPPPWLVAPKFCMMEVTTNPKLLATEHVHSDIATAMILQNHAGQQRDLKKIKPQAQTWFAV